MKRLIKIVLLIPVLYTVAMPFWFSHSAGQATCGGLKIIVRDSADYRFVTSGEIRSRINSGKIRYSGVPVDEIDLKEIETRVSTISELRKTEAYFTLDGMLNVEVDQRRPVLRVMSSSGLEYYVDNDGYIIRKRGLYSPRIHIASGRIDIKEGYVSGSKVGDAGVPGVLTDLFTLTGYLRDNQLWSAMIDQIEVRGNGDLVLIPRTGGHRVIFGDISDMEEKFTALGEFYRQVMPETGWDRYSSISLKYRGQVVCRRK